MNITSSNSIPADMVLVQYYVARAAKQSAIVSIKLLTAITILYYSATGTGQLHSLALRQWTVIGRGGEELSAGRFRKRSINTIN